MSQPWTHSGNGEAYARAAEDHYVEPFWVSERLFEEEDFAGRVHDPACGFGRIVKSASEYGFRATGADIVRRMRDAERRNFLASDKVHDNLVFNPPFDLIQEFAAHALAHVRFKVAMIMPTARLNAARWLVDTPLLRVWLLTPRPSMPPGHVITANGKVGGGKSDYCWLVWKHGYQGKTELRWLHRDRSTQQ